MNSIEILTKQPSVINLGIKGFAEDLAIQEIEVIHVNWKPAPQNKEMAKLLDDLL